MQKITLVLIFGLLINLNTFAQNSYNTIVFSEDGDKFWVVMNGVRQNDAAETNVKIVGLNSNNYRFKIVFQDATIPDLDKNLYMPENSAEVTYRIKLSKKGEYKLRYFSEVPLPPKPVQAPAQQMVTYSATEVYAANPREEVTTTTTTTTTTGTDPTGGSSENVSVDMNIAGVSMGVNINVSDNYGNTGTTTTTSSTTTTTTSSTGSAAPVATTTHDHYVMTGYSGPVGCPWPMEEADYAAAKSTIASQSFDDTRVTVAKQIVGANCLFADQVSEITKMMSFEESKLDFAKYAYTRTYDQGNYFKVNNAFDFESTIEELNEYINAQH